MAWSPPQYDSTVYDEKKSRPQGPRQPVAPSRLPGFDPTKWDENGNRIKRQSQFSLKKPAPLAETYKFVPTHKTERNMNPLSKTRVDKRKQSLYFPEDMLAWLQAEADRQDRSLSWIAQKCVQVAKEKIESFPSVAV